MASRPAGHSPTLLVPPRQEFEEKLRERIALGQEIQRLPRHNRDDVVRYIVESGKWRDYNLRLMEVSFTDHSMRAVYYASARESFADANAQHTFTELQHVVGGVGAQLVRLDSILEQLDLYLPPATTPESDRSRDLSRVFVVHGRDTAARDAVARHLGQLGITPIILSEQVSQSRTVIEKIEANSRVGFAVILLTPDDEGNLKGETPRPRARQNVVLELGYFIGLLGRKYVCAFQCGGVEIPSDFLGVVAEEFDAGGGWKTKLAAELKAAGFPIDLNKMLLP
jgi:predicted nucleotide-binding protein